MSMNRFLQVVGICCPAMIGICRSCGLLGKEDYLKGNKKASKL